MMNRSAPLVLLLVLAAGAARAQTPELSFAGYAKSLALRGSSVITGDSYFYDLSRLRIKALSDYGSLVHAELWLDTELLYGSWLQTPDYSLAQRFAPATYFDLDAELASSEKSRLSQRLFRAFATLNIGEAQITFGRQRIAWGTGFVWNPTDLLNPTSPFAVEREEKNGVDAGYVFVPIDDNLRLEAAYAPARDRERQSYAGRLASSVGAYDFSLMAGRFRGDVVLGGDFAGYAGGAGLRGELTWTQPRTGEAYLRAVLNWDNNFPGDYYVFVEYHFNGSGAARSSEYDYTTLLDGSNFALARHYLAVLFSKDLTPLISLSGYAIINLNDNSALLGPSLLWSARENLELSLSLYAFMGEKSSEMGAQKNAAFAQVQYFF